MSTVSTDVDSPSVFISYSHHDEKWLEHLQTHLKPQELLGHCDVWDDRRISVGGTWHDEILAAMNRAAVAVLLISRHFLGSDFIMNTELPHLLQRRSRDGLRLIPILVSHCQWKEHPSLAEIELRPRDAKPLNSLPEHEIDRVLNEIVREMHDLVGDSAPRAHRQRSGPCEPSILSIGRLPYVGKRFLPRRAHQDKLDEAWEDDSVAVVSVVGIGGSGKTTLVKRWLDTLRAARWRGAEQVLAWSFSRQGDEGAEGTPEEGFMEDIVSRFGDVTLKEGSPWTKGEKVAALLRKRRSLLVLDGLEQAQTRDGGLSDPFLRSLVTGLIETNGGLCVITSRSPVLDIADQAHDRAPVISLDRLEAPEGARLLWELGVRGPHRELERASEALQGHCLGLVMFAGYVRGACDGDLGRVPTEPMIRSGTVEGSQTDGMMKLYEEWLTDNGRPNAKLALIRVLALFDFPASAEALSPFLSRCRIKHLTEPLVGLSTEQVNDAATALSDYGLLSRRELDQALYLHPLVRKYFADKLREQYLRAWRRGHRRLYRHLRRAEPQEKTIGAYEPLFAACSHAARAGDHQKAVDFYLNRIERGDDWVATMELCAYGESLAVLRECFKTLWTDPKAGLKPKTRIELLRKAGYCLRSLGHTEQALEATQVSLRESLAIDAWYTAAKATRNISEIHLEKGNLVEAELSAREGVKYACASRDAKLPYELHATLGDALCHLGEFSAARAEFRLAEDAYRAVYPGREFLGDAWGYSYCDLLIEEGRVDEARHRAEVCLGFVKLPLYVGLCRLAWATALLHIGRADGGPHQATQTQLDSMAEAFEEAGFDGFRARGLVVQAGLRQLEGASGWAAAAAQDLDRAEEIAERCQAKLNLAEVRFEKARLLIARAEAATSSREQRELAGEADKLLPRVQADVERMHYGRLARHVQSAATKLSSLL